jgi:membrane protein
VSVPGARGLTFLGLVKRAIRGFTGHRMTTYAAALAYRGLFALFPFVLLVVLFLGFFDFADLFDQLAQQARSEQNKPLHGALRPAFKGEDPAVQWLAGLVQEARKAAGGGLASFGVAASLYAAARTLSHAMNAAYEVLETHPGWKRSLLAGIFGPALALVVVIALVLMLVGPKVVEWLAGLVGLDELFVALWAWLRLPLALLFLAVALMLVYRFGPDVDQTYRSVVLGAGLAVVAWLLTSIGFSVYLAYFADYGATYGSLGTAIGLLFYLCLSAGVVLAGAEVNAVVYHHGIYEQTGEEASRRAR